MEDDYKAWDFNMTVEQRKNEGIYPGLPVLHHKNKRMMFVITHHRTDGNFTFNRASPAYLNRDEYRGWDKSIHPFYIPEKSSKSNTEVVDSILRNPGLLSVSWDVFKHTVELVHRSGISPLLSTHGPGLDYDLFKAATFTPHAEWIDLGLLPMGRSELRRRIEEIAHRFCEASTDLIDLLDEEEKRRR